MLHFTEWFIESCLEKLCDNSVTTPEHGAEPQAREVTQLVQRHTAGASRHPDIPAKALLSTREKFPLHDSSCQAINENET